MSSGLPSREVFQLPTGRAAPTPFRQHLSPLSGPPGGKVTSDEGVTTALHGRAGTGWGQAGRGTEAEGRQAGGLGPWPPGQRTSGTCLCEVRRQPAAALLQTAAGWMGSQVSGCRGQLGAPHPTSLGLSQAQGHRVAAGSLRLPASWTLCGGRAGRGWRWWHFRAGPRGRTHSRPCAQIH